MNDSLGKVNWLLSGFCSCCSSFLAAVCWLASAAVSAAVASAAFSIPLLLLLLLLLSCQRIRHLLITTADVAGLGVEGLKQANELLGVVALNQIIGLLQKDDQKVLGHVFVF